MRANAAKLVSLLGLQAALCFVALATLAPHPCDPSCAASAARANPPTVTLALGGDVMLGRLVNDVIRRRGARHVWGNVWSLLRAADLTLVNLECVIADGGRPFHPPRVFSFRGHPQTVHALADAGIDFVSLANNHAMDYRAEGLLETIGHLDRLSVAHAGAGVNREAAQSAAFLDASGLRIAVLAFADHPDEYAATADSPGTHVLPVDIDTPEFATLADGIAAARVGGADLVVVSAHWGPNMRPEPTPTFVRFAHAVMDAGADIFHGHSAHIFQGIELYRGNKLILYDTGDLIDDYHVDPVLRNDLQLLVLVTAGAAGVTGVELVPLSIDHMQVNRAARRDAEAIAQRIMRLSEPFGTRIGREADRLVVRDLSLEGH